MVFLFFEHLVFVQVTYRSFNKICHVCYRYYRVTFVKLSLLCLLLRFTPCVSINQES